MSFPVGETAAITVSIFWTICSILFTIAGKRLGILSLNGFRTIMALCLLGSAHIILLGTIIPAANGTQWSYLMLSGIIGLGIGDFGYFGALVHIGPRRGLLLMSTHPIFSLISAYYILNENPGMWALVGIAVTLIGVGIVIVEKEGPAGEPILSRRHKTLGVTFGFIGALGQGLGLVLSKYGMIEASGSGSDSLNPLSATLIRMIAAVIFIWIVILLSGRATRVIHSSKDMKGLKYAFGGAIFGPFLGVWMSMVAVSHAIAGVAATLMSLMPVVIIPVVWILYRQKTNIRGIMGAIVAVVGVGILFLL